MFILCVKVLFRFIKIIELVYVKKPTPKTMMAYVDEDLVEAINTALLASEIIRGDFLLYLRQRKPNPTNLLFWSAYWSDMFTCKTVGLSSSRKVAKETVLELQQPRLQLSEVSFTQVQSKAVNKAEVELKRSEEVVWDAAKGSVLEYTNN